MSVFDMHTLLTSPKFNLQTAGRVGVVAASAMLVACAPSAPVRAPDIAAALRAELPAGAAATSPKPGASVPAQVSAALAEPTTIAAPVPEPRLDLLVNNASVRDVFLAIVADTRYSMLMHPDVKGTLSVTLRGVTVKEALESIRDVYGYDFKIDGRRITVYPPTLQTRIFTINYPTSLREGNSRLQVASGAVMNANNGMNGASGSGSANSANNSMAGGGSNVTQSESSRVSTTTKSDFWTELATAVRGFVGSGEGRSVITSPQAGIVAVRGMPDELRQVEKFLKAAQISVERQVMLEAKVVEVELRDGYQSGVNWAAFGADATTSGAAGVLGSSITSTNPLLQTGGTTVIPNPVSVPSLATGGGVFGLALATSQFATVMGFLETQGDVQTLSSPRVATLNNQKAVLKVGVDDFFITNVSGGSSTPSSGTSAATSNMPTLTLTPFFSGISLDVTPQVDDTGSVTLHVHPSVSTVTEKTKQIDLGTIGNYRLPLASSSVNETDTLVRIRDGHIVAIGGLMQMESARNTSGMPGAQGLGVFSSLFSNKSVTSRKKEVIVLIKPTVIRSSADWEAQGRHTQSVLDSLDTGRTRVITLDGAPTN